MIGNKLVIAIKMTESTNQSVKIPEIFNENLKFPIQRNSPRGYMEKE